MSNILKLLVTSGQIRSPMLTSRPPLAHVVVSGHHLTQMRPMARKSEETEEEGETDTSGYFTRDKYTTSDAHLKHKAYQNFRWGDEEVDEVPVYERPILLVSAAIFFIYFGYLREANDLDQKMGASLFENAPHLEVPLIEVAIQDAERFGRDATLLKERLAELKSLKEEVKQKQEKGID